MSEIKIYKSNITPDRNALLENISMYLEGLTPTYSDSTFQYQKLGLDLTIKIVANQEKVGKSIGNYCSIKQDNKMYYFFVLGSTWISKEAVELKLSMDTVNTFAADLTFNKKTKIERQHKDRFTVNSKGEVSYNLYDIEGLDRLEIGMTYVIKDIFDPLKEYQGILSSIEQDEEETDRAVLLFVPNGSGTVWQAVEDEVIEILDYNAESICNGVLASDAVIRSRDIKRKIDIRSEGTNPVLYHDTNEDVTLEDFSRNNLDWYLVYKSHSDAQNQPVECFLTASTQLNVKFPTNEFTLVPTSFELNKYYYLPLNMNIIDNNETYYICQNERGQLVSRQNVVIQRVANDKITIYVTKWVQTSTGTKYQSTYSTHADITSIKFNTTADSIQLAKSNNLTGQGGYLGYPGAFLPLDYVDVTFTNAGYTTQQMKDIYSIDRSDSKLIKIIKLPYVPNDYVIDENGIIQFEDNLWTFDSNTKLLKLTSINEKFESEIISEINPFEILDASDVRVHLNRPRDDSNESKLYHSDYYLPKFCYDSFNLGLALEKVDLDNNDLKQFRFNFIPTTTINSKFLFELPQYKLKYATEDYPNIISVSRNNEITLYNDAYINYVKTGYNYDVKNKERTTQANWIGTTISLIGGIAGLAAGAVSGGLSAAVGIGLITSAASSIATNINSTITQEASIEQKLNQYKSQAATVSGSDDVDLMSYYCGNKAQLKYYRISEQLRKQFADLFYYCGYADNIQEIPNLNTRYWFNYIQCSPVFNEESTTPYQDYLNDIKARYQTGITVYHYHNGYDWNQEKENWEVEMI